MALKVSGTGLDLAAQKIINLADPAASSDAATKAYVDNAIRGLDWKPSVVAAAASQTPITGLPTVDGITLTAGQRILLMGQASLAQNGIWTVASSGWTRPADYASGSTQDSGIAVTVEEGTTYGGKVLMITGATNAQIVVDTDLTSWSQLGGGSTPTAGNGISVTGTTIAVKTKATGSGLIADSNGLYVDRSTTPQKFATNVPAGATTATINHNLGTTDVTVSVYDISGAKPVLVLVEQSITDANNVLLTFGTAPTSGQYRAVVTG